MSWVGPKKYGKPIHKLKTETKFVQNISKLEPSRMGKKSMLIENILDNFHVLIRIMTLA
jgi:hypothetical protein